MYMKLVSLSDTNSLFFYAAWRPRFVFHRFSRRAIQRSIFRMSIVPNEPILRAVCLSSFLHLLVIRFLFVRARVKITARIPLCVLINFLMFSRCSFTNNKKILQYKILQNMLQYKMLDRNSTIILWDFVTIIIIIIISDYCYMWMMRIIYFLFVN